MYDRGLCRPLAAGWTHSCPPTRLCCPACVRAKRPGVRWFSTALRRPATKNQQSPVIPKEKTCRRVAQVCGARPSPGAATCPPCQCRVVTFTNRPVFSCFCTCRQGASEFPALTGLDPLSAARIDPTPAPFPSGEPPVCNVRHAERLILKAVKNKRKASLQPRLGSSNSYWPISQSAAGVFLDGLAPAFFIFFIFLPGCTRINFWEGLPTNRSNDTNKTPVASSPFVSFVRFVGQSAGQPPVFDRTGRHSAAHSHLLST